MQAVIEYYKTLGKVYTDALEDMLVFDAVIANIDSLFGNFGFLVDSKVNTLAGPAPLFDHGNSLFNYVSQMEVESKQALLEFAEAQRPVCYNDFFSAAISCLKPRHREGLLHLLEFKLKRHPRYNLEPKRLKLIETAIRQRAARLLEG